MRSVCEVCLRMRNEEEIKVTEVISEVKEKEFA